MEDNASRNDQKSNGSLHPRTVGRATVVLVVAVLLFCLLLLRIFLYQTVSFEHYQQKVLEQMTTVSTVHAARGSIYDKNGVLLATNISTYRVFISPSTIASTQIEYDRDGIDLQLDELIAEKLSSILGCTYEFALKQTTYTGFLDRTIKKEVREEDADRVRAFIDEYDLEQMIYLESTHTRYYPYATLASHVLGFTGSDGVGLYGLENEYNEKLAGIDGRYVTARDSSGKEMPYSYKEYIEAQNGCNVHTTLDVFVQSALEEQLSTAYIESGGENRAAGIVMDVKTGAILGMAVYPSFDLNDPWDLDDQSIEKLAASGHKLGSDAYNDTKVRLLQEMWKNKAITEAYIPGSTFKVVTAAMAVEENVITSLSESYECEGYHVVLGQTIRCHKREGHGRLTFTEGIQQSCNPWLMRLGQRLGEKTFYDYLRAFGYLEKTGIDLPGEGKSIFATEENFTELDLAIYAFGQNFNITLIQQITAISAVANGGYLVTPHTVSSITDENGTVVYSHDSIPKRQAVSEETCATVADILEKGVSGDGGAKNAYVAGYRIAAKTGTSEKKERECPICDSTGEPRTRWQCPECDSDKEPASTEDENTKTCTSCHYKGTKNSFKYTYYQCAICKYEGETDEFEVSEDYVCSTVAFAPAEDPQYAVIIIVDEPTQGSLYGSTVAAPYVGKVMESILPHLGVEAVYTEEELEKKTVSIPSVAYWTVSAARKQCAARGITLEVIGDEDGVIQRQYPESGTVVEKSAARLIVYTGNSSENTVQYVTLPDLRGMTALAANQTLINLGLNIRIEGTKNYLSGTGPRVVSQSVEAGSEIPLGTVVEVTLRYENESDYKEDWWDGE